MSINATSLFLFWWMPIPQNVTLQFLPSISQAEPAATWKNATKWIEDTEYQFNNLEPYTRYNVTIYVRIKGQSVIFPPAKYRMVMTGEGTPTAPWNLTVTQRNGTSVELTWQPPIHPNGIITGYEGFITPPIPPMQMSFLQKTSQVIDIAFEAGKNYSFWVVAKNKKFESPSSNVATLTFDGAANIDNIEDLKVLDRTNHSVTLSWKKLPDVDVYHITPRGPPNYAHLKSVKTTSNTYTVEGLAPGTRYTFDVNASKKNYVGRVASVNGMTKDTALPLMAVPELHLMKNHGTTVKLSWDPPKSGNRKVKWQYAVYYAVSMTDLYKGKYNVKKKHL